MTARFRSKNIAEVASAVTAVWAATVLAATPQAQSQQGQTQQTGRGRTGVQTAQPAAPNRAPAAAAPTAVPALSSTPVPPDFLIGPNDVLAIVYWRDKDMSGDVSVRPDGKITLPLLNEVQAAGLTPAQLRDRLVEESKKFIEDPNVTVVVRQINSRTVFITGEVAKPGPYQLGGPTTVLQLIALAGGLRDYADGKKIVIVRTNNGRAITLPFNYKDVTSRKSLRQNIELKPGDTVVVP